MRRGALIGAALAASLAAVFAVGLSGAGAAPRVSPQVNVQPYVYVSIADVSATEGKTAEMTIFQSAKVAFPVEVYWETSNGTAKAGLDYAYQTGKAVIPAGQTSTKCLVSSKADAIHEPNRTFDVNLWSDNHAVRFKDAKAVFTIVDDDQIPTVNIGDAPTITEGGNLTYALTLSNPTADAVMVNVDPAGAGTSPTWNGNDYTGTAPTQVTFAPLATSAQYTFHTIDDSIYEGQEHAWLHLTGATNAVLPSDYTGWGDQTDAWANGIVNDNESPPVVAISDANPLHVNEGGNLVFTLTLSGKSEQSVDVAIDPYGAGSSLNGADYSTAPATSVHFDPLVTSVTYTLHTLDDNVYEGEQHAWLHLTGVTGGFMPATDWIAQYDQTDAWAIGFADDNESMPTVHIANAPAAPTCSGISFPLTLSGPSETDVAVTLTWSALSYYASWDGYTVHNWSSSSAGMFGATFNPLQTSTTLSWGQSCANLDAAMVTVTMTVAYGALLPSSADRVAYGTMKGWGAIH